MRDSPPRENSGRKGKRVKKLKELKYERKLVRPSSSKGPSRRNIQKIMTQNNLVDYHRKVDVARTMGPLKGIKDNIFVTNCDTWSKMQYRPALKNQGLSSLSP